MPEKEIRPRPGEVWKKRFKIYGGGRDADEAICFIYEENGKLYKVWFRGNWKSDLVKEDMIDVQNGWKRVYVPPLPMNEVFFK